jgi:hypothetical protein
VCVVSDCHVCLCTHLQHSCAHASPWPCTPRALTHTRTSAIIGEVLRDDGGHTDADKAVDGCLKCSWSE